MIYPMIILTRAGMGAAVVGPGKFPAAHYYGACGTIQANTTFSASIGAWNVGTVLNRTAIKVWAGSDIQIDRKSDQALYTKKVFLHSGRVIFLFVKTKKLFSAVNLMYISVLRRNIMISSATLRLRSRSVRIHNTDCG